LVTSNCICLGLSFSAIASTKPENDKEAKQEDEPTNKHTIDKRKKKEMLARRRTTELQKMPQKSLRRKDNSKFKTMLNSSRKPQIIDAII